MADQQARNIVKGSTVELQEGVNPARLFLRFNFCDKSLNTHDTLTKMQQLNDRIGELYPNLKTGSFVAGTNMGTGEPYFSLALPPAPTTSPERENILNMQTALVRDMLGTPHLERDKPPTPVDDKSGCEMRVSDAPEAITSPSVKARSSGHSIA